MQTALLFLSPFPFYKHFRIVYGINPNSTNHSDPQQVLFLSPFPFYKHFRIVYGINPNSTNHSDPQQGF